MPGPQPWQIEAARCARRTREELIEYAPKRPLPLRDTLRLKVMQARCETCGGCPLILRALNIMLPEEEKPSAQIIRLAG
jgi:hypothetical protein